MALAHGVVHPVGQQQAVWQMGQGVKMGHVLQLLLVVLHGRYVHAKHHVVAHRALAVGHCADGHHLGIRLAIFAHVPNFAVPVTLRPQALP